MWYRLYYSPGSQRPFFKREIVSWNCWLYKSLLKYMVFSKRPFIQWSLDPQGTYTSQLYVICSLSFMTNYYKHGLGLRSFSKSTSPASRFFHQATHLPHKTATDRPTNLKSPGQVASKKIEKQTRPPQNKVPFQKESIVFRQFLFVVLPLKTNKQFAGWKN